MTRSITAVAAIVLAAFIAAPSADATEARVPVEGAPAYVDCDDGFWAYGAYCQLNPAFFEIVNALTGQRLHVPDVRIPVPAAIPAHWGPEIVDCDDGFWAYSAACEINPAWVQAVYGEPFASEWMF